MLRYAASIQYDGSGYYGWQTLKTGLPTVQKTLEKALSKVADHPVSVICAGRTDTGAHEGLYSLDFKMLTIRLSENSVRSEEVRKSRMKKRFSEENSKLFNE